MDAGELGLVGVQLAVRVEATSGAGDWTLVLSVGELGAVAVHQVELVHAAGEVTETAPATRRSSSASSARPPSAIVPDTSRRNGECHFRLPLHDFRFHDTIRANGPGSQEPIGFGVLLRVDLSIRGRV